MLYCSCNCELCVSSVDLSLYIFVHMHPSKNSATAANGDPNKQTLIALWDPVLYIGPFDSHYSSWVSGNSISLPKLEARKQKLPQATNQNLPILQCFHWVISFSCRQDKSVYLIAPDLHFFLHSSILKGAMCWTRPGKKKVLMIQVWLFSQPLYSSYVESIRRIKEVLEQRRKQSMQSILMKCQMCWRCCTLCTTVLTGLEPDCYGAIHQSWGFDFYNKSHSINFCLYILNFFYVSFYCMFFFLSFQRIVLNIKLCLDLTFPSLKVVFWIQ